MPLGDESNSYALIVDVRAIDVVGAYNSLSQTITVNSPPTSQVANLVSNAVNSIDTSSGDASSVVATTSTLSSAATLLNTVYDSGSSDSSASDGKGGGNDDEAAARAAQAEALRESL